MPIQKEEPAAPQARSVLITREYIERFGSTPGCAKCIAIALGDGSQPTLAHDAVCRKRIESKRENEDVKRSMWSKRGGEDQKESIFIKFNGRQRCTRGRAKKVEGQRLAWRRTSR